MGTHIRVIGDVHGFIDERAAVFGRNRHYLSLIKDVPYSVQLGDFGFIPFIRKGGHAPITVVMERGVDPEKHKVLLGNHDQYDFKLPHYLGDFGKHSIPLRDGSFDFFYMRGAFSIDFQHRICDLDWFPQEELTWEEGDKAFLSYQEMRPRTMFTHDCPTEIVYTMAKFYLGDFHASRTHQYLQAMFEEHKPELWVFGHHHHNWVKEWKGTTFMCLTELAHIDFDEDGHLLTKNPV
jgi:hypothetical protein